jgi:general L-amino acid transport system substrate-binding protein
VIGATPNPGAARVRTRENSWSIVAMAFRVAAVAALCLVSVAAHAQTLASVRERGRLNCGVNPGLMGFASRDDKGNWAGFDVDFCRALSAAIFNDPAKIEFVPLTNEQRLPAVKAREVDVLSRNTTWTISREASYGVNFAAVTYYDGQGFLVRASLKVETALELAGKSICTQTGTTTELNLADYFRSNGMKYEAKPFATGEDALKAYEAGTCDVLTSDISQLHAERLKLSEPTAHTILPDIISKEPLAPVVRQGDDQWFKIVQWTHFAMLNAEELGVSSKTIARDMGSDKPAVKRLLGLDGDFGEQMGLSNDWAARIIKLVGNYDEVFERNVGTGSALGIPRGINQLWTAGGIQYAPPIR